MTWLPVLGLILSAGLTVALLRRGRNARRALLRDLAISEARYQALLEVNVRHYRVMTERENRFRALLEGTQEAIAAFVRQRIVLANPAAVRIFGYASESDVQGMHFSRFFAPEEEERLSRMRDAAALGREEIATFEAVAVRADGSRFDVEVKPTRIVLEGQDTLQVTVRDVTDRKRAYEALQRSLRQQEALLNGIPDAVWMKDHRHRYIAVNEAFERLVETPRDQIIGRTDFEIFPADLAEKFRAEDMTVLEQGGNLHVSDTITPESGVPVLLETVKTPIRGPGARPSGTAGMARDVTERKQMEEQLLQSRKMEAVGRLAGGIAHDFNNLLMTILGYCEFVSKQLPEGSPIRGDLAEIERAGNQAASLTRQLLAFSRKQVIEPRPLDLNSVVAESSRMLRRLIGEDVQLTTLLDPDLGTVRADEGQVEQILMNLAVNSRDAMPRGGRLRIETRNVDLSDPDASGIRRGRFVELAVSDTGMGMDADVRRKIFEPFFTTKEPGKGTGLGLSTVYGIVQQSGGEIRVASEPGKGATFRILLPRIDTAPAPVREAPPETDAAEGSETILLVEDEPALRKLTRRVLRDRGYRVLDAPDGEAAWQLAVNAGGAIGLVLTDAVMPGMSGPDLARQLTTEWPNIKVLVMSGYTGDPVDSQYLLEGAAFLQKPFHFDVLLRRVRDILDEKTAAPAD